jgi:hypothetical protein
MLRLSSNKSRQASGLPHFSFLWHRHSCLCISFLATAEPALSLSNGRPRLRTSISLPQPSKRAITLKQPARYWLLTLDTRWLIDSPSPQRHAIPNPAAEAAEAR